MQLCGIHRSASKIGNVLVGGFGLARISMVQALPFPSKASTQRMFDGVAISNHVSQSDRVDCDVRWSGI